MDRYVLAGIASVVLSAVIVPGPAVAGSKPCPRYEQEVPEGSELSEGGEGTWNDTVRVTPSATEDDPLVIEYSHETAQSVPFHQADPVMPDHHYFTFQVVPRSEKIGLYLRLEWPTPSPTDIDAYLFDRYGAMVGASEAFNNVVLDEAWNAVYPGGTGGEGYEFIPGLRASRCEGFTLQSEASSAPLGADVTLKAWLGPVEPATRF